MKKKNLSILIILAEIIFISYYTVISIRSQERPHLAAKQHEEAAAIRNSGKGSVFGKILLVESYFHEGSTVVLRSDRMELTARTNEKGEYRFIMVPAGIYRLLAKADKYSSAIKESIAVGKNSSVKLGNIVLKPAYDSVYPEIVRSKPKRGAKYVQIPNTLGMGGLDAGTTMLYLSFDFTKPMNKSSVEKAVIFTPFTWRTFSWVGDRRLLIKCDSLAKENPLKPATEYKIEFSEGAAAIDGEKLVKIEPFVFTTGGLKAVASTPAANSKSHSPVNTNFEFFFNFPLEESSVNGTNISIFPGIQGKISLKKDKGNIIIFTADSILPAATACAVTFKKELRTRSGEKLGTDMRINFTTEPLKVYDSWPKEGDNNIKTSGFPYIFFNSKVSKESAAKAISLEPEVATEFVWKKDAANTEYCILKHKQYYNANTEYTVRIADSLTDLYGKKLSKAYKFNFKTEPCKVFRMDPAEESRKLQVNEGIKIYFNALMNQKVTENYITLEPREDITFIWSTLDNYDIVSIEAKNGWKPRSSYTVKISKAAKGKNGKSLSRDFKSVFSVN